MVKYLLQKKFLQIQGLGIFRLNQAEMAGDDQKAGLIPPGSVSFSLDSHTLTDPELVAFIATETGKIKPLAAADLESAILQGRQLLNISKPFTIEGLGTLQKDMRNDIEFIQYVTPDKNEQRSRSEKRKEDNAESIHFDDNYLKPLGKKNNRSRNLAFATLVILGLGIIGWVGYFFYQRSLLQEIELSPISLSSAPVQDSSAQMNGQQSANDSIQNSIPLPKATVSDVEFKVVVEIANKTRAYKRFADLKEWGHKVVIYTNDSVKYKIAFPIKAPLSDSIRYRDSLSRFFGKKVWIENK
jgi:hypothetical protein